MESLGALIAHFVSIGASLDWVQWLLLWVLAFIPFMLWMAHRAENEFDLKHLIADRETGKVDRFAFSFIVALVVSSWLMLFYGMAGKLTWEWFGIYMGVWAAPKLVEKWLETKKVVP